MLAKMAGNRDEAVRSLLVSRHYLVRAISMSAAVKSQNQTCKTLSTDRCDLTPSTTHPPPRNSHTKSLGENPQPHTSNRRACRVARPRRTKRGWRRLPMRGRAQPRLAMWKSPCPMRFRRRPRLGESAQSQNSEP